MDATVEQHSGGTRMVVSVWDTGVGISKAEQKKIFDRFYRAPNLTADQPSGMGIGLSLVKALVGILGGTLELISNPGSGSVFTVHLPIRKAEIGIKETKLTKAQTVLLIDDNPDIIQFNRSIFEQVGYTVLDAPQGKLALDIIAQCIPDIIITDIMMPELDGMELVRALKESPGTQSIPVVMLSARTNAKLREEAAMQGALAYLSKPYNPEELLAIVENLLRMTAPQVSPGELAPPEDHHPFIKLCLELIERHLDDETFSVEKLAELMFTNRSHFQRKVKSLTGSSPSELIRNARLAKSRELLLKREGNITEVAYKTGFTSQSYFTKCFSDHFGYPPSQLLRTS